MVPGLLSARALRYGRNTLYSGVRLGGVLALRRQTALLRAVYGSFAECIAQLRLKGPL